MKALTTFISLTLALCSVTVAQNWEAIEFPVEEGITGVCFVHPDTGFFVTKTGKMFSTYDACRTWTTYNVVAGVVLEDLQFFDSQVGYVCGQFGSIYKTTDGGYTWESQLREDSLSWLFDLQMIDRKNGIAVGLTRREPSPTTGQMYRTTDGGKSWKEQEVIGMGYSEAYYSEDGTLYLLSFGRLNYSTDEGKSWNAYAGLEGSPARACSFYGNTGIMCGLQGMVAYSADRGKSWMPSMQDRNTMFIAAQLVNEQVGYIGGTNETVLRTVDGGKTWNRELPAKYFDVLDLAYTGGFVYAVGSDGGVMRKQEK